MKTTALLISLITIAMLSCGQINEKELVGTWKVIDFSADLPSTSPVLIWDATEMALLEVYTFNPDHTFSITPYETEGCESGTWEITSVNELILTFQFDCSSPKASFQIVLLEDNMMKWKNDIADLGSISYTLKKN